MSLEDYAKNLGGGSSLVEKASKLSEIANQICPEKIEAFFISEYEESDGKRVLESLWFFSKTYVMESKRIQLDDMNIDLMCINKYLDRIEIDYSDYEPTKATDDSSLSVFARIGSDILSFQASGLHCDTLWKIFLNYIQPNIYPCVS